MFKTCSKCKIYKSIEEFYNSKNTKDKKESACKKCESKRHKETYKIKFEIILNKNKIWYENNKEFKIAYDKQHKLDNKKHYSNYRKEYVKINRLKINERINNWAKKRRKINILHKLKENIRIRTNFALRDKIWNKQDIFYNYIGCSIEFLKQHLESKFTKGMTWDNYGKFGWHIDHIVPLSSAKTPEKLYKLCHYTNLQPLWAKDNLKKGNRIL